MTLDQIDGAELHRLLPPVAAVAALRTALLTAAPIDCPPRVSTPVKAGELLLMPADSTRHVGIKIVGVVQGNPALGLPRITGSYLLHDATTLLPRLLIDGAALTLLRTAAVSALAIDELAAPGASTMLLYGTGQQAEAHIAAVAAIRPLTGIAVVGRTPESTAAFVAKLAPTAPVRAATPDDLAHAELVVCCTSTTTPLFDGSGLAEHATVVAMGSHTEDARELDATTLRRSTVVVEDPCTALREAADVADAVATGEVAELIGLADLVAGRPVDRSRPRVFRSVGMAWEDLVVAEAAAALMPTSGTSG